LAAKESGKRMSNHHSPGRLRIWATLHPFEPRIA
jgi:hypothetical protein